jgi:ATP-dependent helicase IRC3
MPRGKRMLFLVHRNELAYQAAEKMAKYNPHLRVGMEKAEHRADNADIVVASVQTIGRSTCEIVDGEERWEYCDRIKQFRPDDFAVIQADECHHIPKSKTWLSVLRYFQVLKNAEHENRSRLFIGWTATPGRADNEGLESICSEIVYNYGIREAITDGWLAPIVAYRVETQVDLAHVKTVQGDFSLPDLTSAINTPERNELIAQKYAEICPNTPAIFFTTEIAHSFDLAEVMRRHSFKVYPISGDTPTDERNRFLRLFKEGAIHGLTSCGVLSEGVDLPNAEVGFMCRPTKSGLLYRQQVGRILRLSPSPEELEIMRRDGTVPSRLKTQATIVDVCDVSGKHHLIATPSLFGLRSDYDGQGKPIIKQVEEIEDLEKENPTLDLRSAPNLDAIKTSLTRLDLLKPPETPEEIRRISRFTWIKEGESAFRLGMMDGAMLSIRQDTLGAFEICRHMRGVKTPICTAKTLAQAVSQADSEIPDKDAKVMAADASWRREECTQKQISLLFTVDRKLHSNFSSACALYEFALQRFKAGDNSFSRGGISAKIDSLRNTRNAR